MKCQKEKLSKIIGEFEKFPYESYDRKRPKHEPTGSYFYLARQLAKCMMTANTLNSHGYPVRTEMTALSSHVFLLTRTNQKASSRKIVYCRVVLWTRKNQKT